MSKLKFRVGGRSGKDESKAQSIKSKPYYIIVRSAIQEDVSYKPFCIKQKNILEI